MNALYRLLEEVIVDNNAYATTIWRHATVIRHASLMDNDKVAWLYHMLHRIDKVACRPTQTKGEKQALHAAALYQLNLRLDDSHKKQRNY